MASYSFDVEHAEKWGVNEAIFLHNLIHWLRLNKAERRNVQAGSDGVVRVWSYNTTEAIALLYPFWKAHQVRYVIDSLKKQEVIVTDKLSKEKFDRTTWFALVDESLLQLPDPQPDSDARPADGSDPRFEKFRKSKGDNSQKAERSSQDDLRNFSNGAEDSRKSLLGSDVQPADVQPTNIKPTKTFNVSGGDKNISKKAGEDTNSRDTDDNTFAAVRAISEKFQDDKSVRRFKQLRLLCRDNNRLGLWQEALLSTEKRMKRTEVNNPGAYFCSTLVRLLEDAGVNIPAGTLAERAEVRGEIGASLASTFSEEYAAA